LLFYNSLRWFSLYASDELRTIFFLGQRIPSSVDSRGRYSEIRFRDVNGNTLQYQGGTSRKALEKFLTRAYGVCSTFSVSRETTPRPISDVQPVMCSYIQPAKLREWGMPWL